MSSYSHETAPTQFVEADGVRFAYRRFGKSGAALPLLFLQYFNANLDDWDPFVTNGLALDRDVILFDNAGVGSSGGDTPSTVLEMKRQVLAFCRALELKEFDAVGFSLGGMIVQQLAYDHPEVLRRIILLGTGPRGGEGMTFTELSSEEKADPVRFLLDAFFAPTATSQTAGKAFLERLQWRRDDRDLPVTKKSAEGQLSAIREWGTIPSSNRYAMLEKIEHKTLVVHGNKDIVVQPINALILAQGLPDAQLVVYPDSSHGAHYQHASLFLRQANLFLNA
jgi:pimeloyl-ACP methyl ester carboxylesterase